MAINLFLKLKLIFSLIKLKMNNNEMIKIIELIVRFPIKIAKGNKENR